tara:strand:- start:139 stop:495 length:357 start_codon:yes stop_codon:yes gene_type:complete
MDKYLKKRFDYFNEKFWKSSLSEINIGFSKNLDNCFGEYIYPKSKKLDFDKNYSIKICFSLKHKRKELNETILHEMCHHAVFLRNKDKYWKKRLSWHGKFWKEEMRMVGFKGKINQYT